MSIATSRRAITRQAGARQAITRQDAAHGSAARQGTDRQETAEADNLAVASFLLGLPGLLLFNIVLGPIAITLATLALTRGTSRRGRAVLGLVLGIASLAILAFTTATSHGVLMDFSS
ncbi:hypothetical protein ATKI12_3208 [Kitasatospora sp. Ki12]|uniref:DUF4190 domain-containing protein n=1 Tax=Kitasatospora xanthocidica TaxID=83382 RepID=UPI0019B06C00|nr:DUF4190 domain-containing protein [Kitasatospora xanthocidica]GHF58580.1 hypothetical protein GCM10018790_40590 [Kitasatospora xanthocidica]